MLHGSTDIQFVTRNIEYGKSVYEIELVRNNNQFFDVIVDPSTGKIQNLMRLSDKHSENRRAYQFF